MRLFPRNAAPTRPPAFLKLRSSKTFILTVVGTAIFTDLFLYGVVVPVLPFALNARVGIPNESVQHWVSVMLAVYSAGLLAFSPIWGWCADHTRSRGAPFLFGLVILLGSTALLAVGNSIAIIIAGRLLQGIAAALVWTVGLAIISDTVGADGLGEAMGWVMLGLGVAVFGGPLLGGIVFAHGGYYAVFIMTFGIIIVDIVLRCLMIEVKVARRYLDVVPEDTVAEPSEPLNHGHSRDDIPVPVEDGAAAATTSSTSPTLAGTTPNATTSNASRAASVRSLASPPSTNPQPRKKRPTLIILLSSPRLWCGLWGCMVAAILNTSFDAVLPLYVKQIFDWDSTGAGLIFIPIFLPTFLQPLIGQFGDRWGYRWLIFGGFLGVFPTFILLRLVTYDSTGQKGLLCALLLLSGLWSACILPNIFAEVTVTVTDREKEEPGVFGQAGAFAQAYALFNAAYGAGSLVGPLWAGFVNSSAGWGAMTLSLGLLSGVSAIPAVLATGGYLFAKGRKGGPRSDPPKTASADPEAASPVLSWPLSAEKAVTAQETSVQETSVQEAGVQEAGVQEAGVQKQPAEEASVLQSAPGVETRSESSPAAAIYPAST